MIRILEAVPIESTVNIVLASSPGPLKFPLRKGLGDEADKINYIVLERFFQHIHIHTTYKFNEQSINHAACTVKGLWKG